MSRTKLLLTLVLLSLVLTACGRNMYDQAKLEPLEASSLFPNGSAMQAPVENTIPRGFIYDDLSVYSGLGAAGFRADSPFPITAEYLARGQERYNIYCAPCHNYSGNGQGMIVQKGFVQPTSFHEQRLRDAQLGYFVNAITNGFGRMYPYAARVPVEDRWAIAAYVKALQYSQAAGWGDVPMAELDGFMIHEARE